MTTDAKKKPGHITTAATFTVTVFDLLDAAVRGLPCADVREV